MSIVNVDVATREDVRWIELVCHDSAELWFVPEKRENVTQISVAAVHVEFGLGVVDWVQLVQPRVVVVDARDGRH